MRQWTRMVVAALALAGLAVRARPASDGAWRG